MLVEDEWFPENRNELQRDRRAAFTRGAEWAREVERDGGATLDCDIKAVAKRRYPITRHTPRVLKDPQGYEWKLEGSRFFARCASCVGEGEWRASSETAWEITTERVKIWLWLIENPHNTIEE
jgi:hypothetical protein